LDEDLRVGQLERSVADAQANDPYGAAAAAARSDLRSLLAELVRHRVAVFAVRAGFGGRGTEKRGLWRRKEVRDRIVLFRQLVCCFGLCLPVNGFKSSIAGISVWV
jgi:hypothetical protein